MPFLWAKFMAPFIQKQASIYPRDPISSPSENGVLEPEYYAICWCWRDDWRPLHHSLTILLMAEILYHLGWCWNPINNGKNYLSLNWWVCRISGTHQQYDSIPRDKLLFITLFPKFHPQLSNPSTSSQLSNLPKHQRLPTKHPIVPKPKNCSSKLDHHPQVVVENNKNVSNHSLLLGKFTTKNQTMYTYIHFTFRIFFWFPSPPQKKNKTLPPPSVRVHTFTKQKKTIKCLIPTQLRPFARHLGSGKWQSFAQDCSSRFAPASLIYHGRKWKKTNLKTKNVSHRHLSGSTPSQKKKKLKNTSPRPLRWVVSSQLQALESKLRRPPDEGTTDPLVVTTGSPLFCRCFFCFGGRKKAGQEIQWSSCCCQVEVNVSTNWIFVISYQVAKELMVYKKKSSNKNPTIFEYNCHLLWTSSSNLFLEGQNQSNRWHVSHHPTGGIGPEPQSSVLRDPFDPRPSPTVEKGEKEKSLAEANPPGDRQHLYMYI